MSKTTYAEQINQIKIASKEVLNKELKEISDEYAPKIGFRFFGHLVNQALSGGKDKRQEEKLEFMHAHNGKKYQVVFEEEQVVATRMQTWMKDAKIAGVESDQRYEKGRIPLDKKMEEAKKRVSLEWNQAQLEGMNALRSEHNARIPSNSLHDQETRKKAKAAYIETSPAVQEVKKALVELHKAYSEETNNIIQGFIKNYRSLQITKDNSFHEGILAWNQRHIDAANALNNESDSQRNVEVAEILGRDVAKYNIRQIGISLASVKDKDSEYRVFLADLAKAPLLLQNREPQSRHSIEMASAPVASAPELSPSRNNQQQTNDVFFSFQPNYPIARQEIRREEGSIAQEDKELGSLALVQLQEKKRPSHRERALQKRPAAVGICLS